MHPTASLVLAHERIADLTADAQRIRLARQALASADAPLPGGPIAPPRNLIARVLIGTVRSLRMAAAI